jgi:holo-[acyl-carrier protein] synthase
MSEATMRIVGHGVDIESEAKIGEYLKSRPDWAERIFSADERKLAGEPSEQRRFYAGRYAGKEAVAKTLGTGFAGDVTWHGIEILRLSSDAPYVRLSGGALVLANELGVTGWFISISHRDGIAVASVIAVADYQ